MHMERDITLKGTMQYFEEQRGWKKSERKWKEKLKEWGCEKNIPAKEMYFMVAKVAKRKLDEGKDTVFYRNGIAVQESRIEQVKKRRLIEGMEMPYFAPDTPPQISYYTPKPSLSNDNEWYPEILDDDSFEVSDSNHSLSVTGGTQPDFTWSRLENDIHWHLLMRKCSTTRMELCMHEGECGTFALWQLVQNMDFAHYLRDSGRRYLAELCYILALEQYSKRYKFSAGELAWGSKAGHYMGELVQYLGLSTEKNIAHSIHVYQRTLELQLWVWAKSPTPPSILQLNAETLSNLLMRSRKSICIPVVKPHTPESLARSDFDLSGASILERLWGDGVTLSPVCSSRPSKERYLSATFRIFSAGDTFMFSRYCVEMLVNHCTLLQRRRTWSELLSFIHCAYQMLATSVQYLPQRYFSQRILAVRSALMSIPRPLGQWISLEEVENILHLDCNLFGHVTTVSRTLGWVEEEELGSENEIYEDETGICLGNSEDVVLEDVQSAEEVETSIGDMSSNKLGMTFTESASGISDLGLNYSDFGLDYSALR